jgi:hypothetical protein
MAEEKKTPSQIPADIKLRGTIYTFVQSQRGGSSAVYKGPDSYLRIGSVEKISSDLALHKRMEIAGFPVAKLICEGELDGKTYFIESSVGERTLSEIFTEETKTSGAISEQSFDQFLTIVNQFAQAQLRTQSPERNFEEFANGIHVDILCQELSQYADRIQSKLKIIQKNTADLPFVLSHGDFNPHNLYAGGVIDLEDSYYAPFGHDLIGGIVSIEYFPNSPEFEFYAKYKFSEEQKKKYVLSIDKICTEHNLPKLSHFLPDFEFTRAVWLLVGMHRWPKLQKFRYEKFIKKFLTN